MSSKAGKSIKKEIFNESNTFIHPKSRKSVAMVKKVKKDSKKEQAKRDTKLKQSFLAEKLLWIQKHMDPDVCPYTVELTAALVAKYIARHDEELEQIKLKRSIGENRNRQHSGREDAIRMTKEREIGDYETCGLEIPNILNLIQCSMLKKWKGDLKFLPNFKLCRFRKKHVDEELKKKQKLTMQNENKNINETVDALKSESNYVEKLTNKSESIDNKNDIAAVIKENGESMDTE